MEEIARSVAPRVLWMFFAIALRLPVMDFYLYRGFFKYRLVFKMCKDFEPDVSKNSKKKPSP
jgi:hypothetical protein